MRNTELNENELKAEHELILRALAGDEDAFAAIYAVNAERVRLVCMKIVKDETIAEDLVQDTFVQLHRKLDSFRGDARLSTYLHRMAVNQCLMRLRQNKKHRVLEALECDGGEGADPVTLIPARPDGSADDRIDLERAIDALPPGYRTVFVLKGMRGLGHDEIAATLGVSEGTSKSQYAKACKKLRRSLSARSNPRMYRTAAGALAVAG